MFCFSVVLGNGNKSTRRFRQGKTQNGVKYGRNQLNSEHPAPGGVFRGKLHDEEIREERQQNTEHDIELKQTGKFASVFGRRNFGDKERSGDG